MLRHLAEIKGDVYSNMTNNVCIMEGKHFTESPHFTPLVVDNSRIFNIDNSPLTVYRWCKDGIESMVTIVDGCMIYRENLPYMFVANSDMAKANIMLKGFQRVDRVEWTAKKVTIEVKE